MKELNVTEFRAQCLSIVDNVPEEGIVITKRGKPVAQLIRLERSRRKGYRVTLPLVIGKGSPGPALGDGLTTPYDLIFD